MGGKNKNSGQSSGSSMQQQSSSSTPQQNSQPQPCEKPVKHWIGVRVEDEAGNLAQDVTIHCVLSDMTFDVGMGNVILDKTTNAFKTDKISTAGTCDFSIPKVYDVEWWPKGDTPPSSFPDEQGASLDPGDCVVSGAAKTGYRDYKTVWNCSGNSDLQTNSPNPNQQTAGTSVRGPAQKTKTVTKATDQAWTFVVRTIKPPKLSLILIDKTGAPLSGLKWELSVLGKSGTTGGDGKIEVTSAALINMKLETLRVTMKAAQTPPTTTTPAPTPASDPPAYPPPIVVADFKDRTPAMDYTEQIVKWNLNVGYLEPFNVHTGALERLHNLGFGCSTDLKSQATSEGEPQTIKAYNKLYSKSATTWDDIKEDVRDRHDTA